MELATATFVESSLEGADRLVQRGVIRRLAEHDRRHPGRREPSSFKGHTRRARPGIDRRPDLDRAPRAPRERPEATTRAPQG